MEGFCGFETATTDELSAALVDTFHLVRKAGNILR